MVFHLKLAVRNLAGVAKPYPWQANHNLAIINMFPFVLVTHTCPFGEVGQDMLDKLAINSIHLDEFHLDNQVGEDKLNSY